MARPAGKTNKKQEGKDKISTIVVEKPSLVSVIIKVSKKRNIVVNKFADNKSIKETWFGTELEFEYKLPAHYTLQESSDFIDEQILLCKQKADEYFVDIKLPEPIPLATILN